MNPYLIAFITGLTTGGLACLAVQGGLLASSLAHQIEQDMLEQQAAKPIRSGKSLPGGKPVKLAKFRPHTALPIALFLAAKVVAYTLLGFLLGALGTVLQLTPMMRAILLVAIGIFMVGNALRMFNIHPIFRIFALEPPKFVTRYIRKTAKKGGADLTTPVFLGALTVLIPCGVTQAMMAVAIGTGDPLQGAMLMLAFTLGTSPVFFAVAYLTTQIGARLEKWFMRFVATVVLVLGILTYISGLRLAGIPINLPNWLQTAPGPQQAGLAVPTSTVVRAYVPSLPTPPSNGASNTAVTTAPAVDPGSPAVVQNGSSAPVSNPVDLAAGVSPAITVAPLAAEVPELYLNALNNGYEPQTLFASAGVPTKLNVVTNNTRSCAVAFVIPDLNYQTLLPVSGRTTIDIPAQAAGKVMAFTCSMGMYTGEIVFK
jgi:sulfite exporter TauE/SafE